MRDILFRNNKHDSIKQLAKKTYYTNKRRNLFATLALVLTTFMITSVFSLGFSYVEAFEIQQIRSMGTTADVAITNITEKQAEELNRSNLVSVIGLSQRLGSIDTTNMGDAKLGLAWIDKNEWERHRLPTISHINGIYPQAENEVMLPLWALNEMGITDPQLGMKITFTYQIVNSDQYSTKEFALSGYYTDYMTSRVGKRGSAYVSKNFADSTGLPFDCVTCAMITFEGEEDVSHLCETLKDKIKFTENQSFEIVPSYHQNSNSLMIAIAFVVIVIMLSGYLLIYNIFYISIAKDTRFYGQLKTIGTTKRQIKKIVRWQILRTAFTGIPAGLLAGGVLSLIVVPSALNMMYTDNDGLETRISCSPIIFIGATVFALITALMGSIKPVRIAGSVSPIAASKYTDVAVKTAGQRKSHRLRLSRMALNNIFRNPKSTVLTFGSLFFGLCLFLISTGLLSSLTPENFVAQWGESDFALVCSLHDKEALITEEILEKIREMDGVENIRLTYSAFPKTTAPVLYNQEVFGQYVNSLDGVSGLDFSNPEILKNHKDNFFSVVYGIDEVYVEELNKTLEHPIDLVAFENGDIVLLSAISDSEGNSLIQPGHSITILTDNAEYTFTIANGFLDADFQSGSGIMKGTAPNLYLSQQALKCIFSETKIFRVDFDTTDGSKDKQVLEELQTMLALSSNVRILSRYEKYKEMEGYLLTSQVLATGLSAVFLLIGIMNFINTMVVSVNTRKHEFAVLESIGMTKKQIKTVLLFEGGYYWIITFLLIATLGTGIYIPLYMAFKQAAYYAVFSYPFAQIFVIAVIVLLICLVVPVVTYKIDIRKTVIDRLRQE